MNAKKRFLIPALAVVAIVVCAVGAASASAAPKWYVGGSELTATESYAGVSEPSTMTASGITTKCEHSYYVASIFNSGGSGKGELTSLPLYECSANGTCILTKVEPKKLPWAMHTTTVGGKPYLIIENVNIEASYTGFFCPLIGTHEVTGTMGGSLENSSQTVVFSKASEEATGASLITWIGFVPVGVEVDGNYTAEDVGANFRGQAVEAK